MAGSVVHHDGGFGTVFTSPGALHVGVYFLRLAKTHACFSFVVLARKVPRQ